MNDEKWQHALNSSLSLPQTTSENKITLQNKACEVLLIVGKKNPYKNKILRKDETSCRTILLSELEIVLGDL